MKNILPVLAAISLLGAGAAPARDFDLDSMSLTELRAASANFKAPAPKPQPAPVPAADELISVDASIRVPFKAVQKAMLQVKGLTVLDQAAPVFSKAGEFLKISNIRVDMNGIIAQPTLTLKPCFDGRDRFAVRIQRIQLHASMMPDKSRAPAQPQLTQEDIMEQVMTGAIKGVMDSLNAKFTAQNKPFRAEDVLSLKYDKAAWTLHGAVSPKFLQASLPQGLVGGIHLTGFGFNETGLLVKVGTAD